MIHPALQSHKLIRAWHTFWFNRGVPLNVQLRRCNDEAKKLQGFTGKLALLSMYTEQKSLPLHTIHYAKQLQQLGYSVLLVDTSPTEHTTDLPYVWRHNAGFDFGSWSFALRWLKLSPTSLESLILLNDSVIGPLFPLAPWFHRMQRSNLDLWAMSDNLDGGNHLQSYFLVLSQTALSNKTFWELISSSKSVYLKISAIRKRELALSQIADRVGLRRDVCCRTQDVLAWSTQHPQLVESGTPETGTSLNPTLFYWDALIEGFQFPFIKRELLAKNRFDSKKIHHWRTLVESSPAWDRSFPIESVSFTTRK